MSKRKKCPHCGHDGLRNVGGFQYASCWDCDGSGLIYIKDDDNEKVNSIDKVKIDKRSKEYKAAVKELEKKGMSTHEAEEIFEKEYSKLEKEHTSL